MKLATVNGLEVVKKHLYKNRIEVQEIVVSNLYISHFYLYHATIKQYNSARDY